MQAEQVPLTWWYAAHRLGGRRPARPWRPAAPPASTSASLLRFFPSVRPDSSLRPPFSWPSSRAASPRRRTRRTAGRRRLHAQAYGGGAAQAVGGAAEGGEERGQGQGATAQEGSWPARSCIGVPSCSRRRPGASLIQAFVETTFRRPARTSRRWPLRRIFFLCRPTTRKEARRSLPRCRRA